MQVTLSAIWLVLTFWLILRAWRPRNAFEQLGSAVKDAEVTQSVAIIVPARNERSNIRPCLESLLNQQYPPQKLRIVVVDDNSTDETATIVGERMPHCARLTLRPAPPLPYGWQGKAHACSIGARAVPPYITWLCFIDADMRASAQLIASAVHSATRDALDLLSLTPRHALLGFAERLIVPCGLYLLGFSQNLAQIQKPHSEDVIATGQFMRIRRAAYERVGGNAAVRAEICEDLELARLLKRNGYRVLLKDGTQLLRGRMYTSWHTLWPGITKNLTDMLGGPAQTAATALIAVVIAWCALHLAGAAHFDIPLWYGLLFPVGYTVGAVMALDSVRRRLTGHVHWKGRVYQ